MFAQLNPPKLAWLVGMWLAMSFAAGATQKVCRILPLGDSITEGGKTFSNYRYPLWEKLFAAGYIVEYVGSRSSESRVGPLKHEGYGGKNAEFVAAALEKNFPKHVADVVLIHAGHNHDASESPVPGIVDAHEAMIRTARKANPNVIVLVAQVIPSGKLPKYAYIPELNAELAKLARKLNTRQSPVMAVDMASGFDWQTDTISDHVHPNVRGAEKMAAKWFSALSQFLPKPPQSLQPEILRYKQASGADLSLHVFRPPNASSKTPRPVVVFFFGGGWRHGTPIQFYPECAHFTSRGLVAISADYRIASVHGTTPFESVADGKSAIRWVRQHAAELGVDPERIIAAGASAGGQVAAATGLVPGLDEAGEDLSVSSRPNAMLLWYPVVDNGPQGYGPPEIKARYREFSPLHHIGPGAPPTLFLLGTKDKYIPVATAEEFKKRMEEHGAICELELFPDAPHPIYNYRNPPSPLRDDALKAADDFLKRLGFSQPLQEPRPTR
jgi:acetyl esterase/lipase